jgi:hypothetical protein
LTHGTWAHADGTTTCTDASSQGQIQRDAHKLVEARGQFIICARQECPGVVRKDCATWLEQVQASLPTVVPIAADEAGNSLPNVRVSVDGKLLVEKTDGRAIEINPGTYTFTFEAPDGTKAESQVVVAEGEKDKRIGATIARPAPAVVAATPPATINGSTPLPASPSTPDEVPHAVSSSSPLKAVGIVTTGLGVVGLGLGAVFGLQASSKKSSAGCDSHSVCPTPTALNTLNTAKGDGNVSTGLFVAGGVLAAGGILIWALAPSSPVQVAPSVGMNTASVLLRGAW